MTISALLMMLFSIVVLWGGLGATIFMLMRHNRELAQKRAEH
ncbi:methionine/alanine import family NSS transporter small subunit [Stomatohabitans albus]